MALTLQRERRRGGEERGKEEGREKERRRTERREKEEGREEEGREGEGGGEWTGQGGMCVLQDIPHKEVCVCYKTYRVQDSF